MASLKRVRGVVTVFEANSFAHIILAQTTGQKSRPLGTAYKRAMEIVFIIIIQMLTVMRNLLQNCKSYAYVKVRNYISCIFLED